MRTGMTLNKSFESNALSAKTFSTTSRHTGRLMDFPGGIVDSLFQIAQGFLRDGAQTEEIKEKFESHSNIALGSWKTTTRYVTMTCFGKIWILMYLYQHP